MVNQKSAYREIDVECFILFQLYFDDYAESGYPDTSRDPSRPTETPESANSNTLVVPDSIKMEMEALRQ
jgi:hypothetical protein